MLKRTSFLTIVLGCMVMTACTGTSQEDSVTGTVTYRQRIALPPGAVVIVRIEDVSLADAPAEPIGEQVTETKGAQVPISFDVKYDPGQIQEKHSYSLRVRIEEDGKLLFINDTSVPVITNGNPTQDVEVLVVPVGG